MGKQEILGYILIGLVLFGWMWFNAPNPAQPGAQGTTDTIQVHEQKVIPPSAPETPASVVKSDSLGSHFGHLAQGNEKIITISTDLYTAEVTTRGGQLRKWELKKYKTWDGYQVQMVDPDHGGDLGLLFLSKDGKEIRTSSLYYEGDFRAGSRFELKDLQSHTVTLVLPVADGKRIVKRMTFRNGTYACEVEIELQNLGDIIANYEYHVTWESGVRFAEHNSVVEAGYARAYALSGGELSELDAGSFEAPSRLDINGSTNWVATRNKYFAVAMIPQEKASQGALLEGTRTHMPDRGESKRYGLNLKMPFKGTSVEGSTVTVFLGPLDFDVVSSYDGLAQIMSLGAAWIIRPISEFVMIPLFNLLHIFIPNYGLVIIVFSIIIKVLLHPLSRTQMKSMKKMQALQPMMTELREKHKDDPQKMNQAIMNLYKDYGVNPASGCLPLLLQMPILFALYAVFQSSIELRQAGFFLWINDLSVPDIAFKLPFTIPLLGMNEMSGLALAMGLTMFIQQKMTVTDPRQKAMVWMMPIMMTLLFNSLPSGLNLYYFVFNLLSIGQQTWMNKTQPDEPLRKVDPKKRAGGFMSKLSKDLPKLKR
jgi:YidC/Oxa1 family membrane protein insertase